MCVTPGPVANVADMSEKLDTVKVDTVSLPIALGLWLMMWPVLTKVRGASELASLWAVCELLEPRLW